MTPILSAKSHANSLISSLRMMNPTEELREGKRIEEILLETLLGIIQDKTDEETNLQEDPIKQIRHSRMDVSYIKTTSGLTVELIQPTPVATGKTMTEDEVGGKNTDAIVEDSLRNLRQVHHQDGGRKITESVETTPSPSVHPDVLTSPSELNAKKSNTRPFEKKRMMMNPKWQSSKKKYQSWFQDLNQNLALNKKMLSYLVSLTRSLPKSMLENLIKNPNPKKMTRRPNKSPTRLMMKNKTARQKMVQIFYSQPSSPRSSEKSDPLPTRLRLYLILTKLWRCKSKRQK